MRSMVKLTLSLALMLLVGGLSGCATFDPGTVIAKHLGKSLGTSLADVTPVHASTSPTLNGGNFCDTALALKAPVAVAGLPRDKATEFALAVDEFGAEHGCWAAPK